MTDVTIRRFRPADLPAMKRITAETFEAVCIDGLIERQHGSLAGTDWTWRKQRHLDADASLNPDGIFVAERDEAVVAYITTSLDTSSKTGHIRNLAVGRGHQGKGLGRRLIQKALDYFHGRGMTWAKIECLSTNETAYYLYTDMGFSELGRQVHFFRKL